MKSYRLLDCGDRRRLEQFSQVTVSRPAPAASFPPALPSSHWRKADLVFEPGKGWRGHAPERWQIDVGGVLLSLRPGPQGQIGVFPEHVRVCDLLDAKISRQRHAPGSLRALNLFAHTGLASLRLALRPEIGETVHVDASRRAVETAKENAAASGLADKPVRWLVDDALAFMAREVRRGRRYRLILADPPSHGRDKKSGKEWRFERDIATLLELSEKLLEPDAGMLCLTCHSEGWNEERLLETLGRFDGLPAKRETLRLDLASAEKGNTLRAGLMLLAHHAE